MDNWTEFLKQAGLLTTSIIVAAKQPNQAVTYTTTQVPPGGESSGGYSGLVGIGIAVLVVVMIARL